MAKTTKRGRKEEEKKKKKHSSMFDVTIHRKEEVGRVHGGLHRCWEGLVLRVSPNNLNVGTPTHD